MSKVYFITGTSSGFGRALAEAVLGRGEKAVLAARKTETVKDLTDTYGDNALAVRLDVTDAGQRRSAVQAALDRFGRVDVLANIAGRGSLGAAEEFSPEQLGEQMAVNFHGAAEMTRLLLPAMRAQGSGHILNLTSIGGVAAFPGFSAYCASKFALEGWSEALRDEVAPLGIRVTIVEPGAFRTEFAGDANMRPATRIDAYRPVIEPVETYLYGSAGQQPGDPALAAKVMIQVVESDAPPLRLLLGADAYGLWEKKRAEEQEEFSKWRQVGEDTAFPGAEVMPVGG
ncbi:MAG: SDR family NAD(P)-dependent oxidoreductase [Fibrella sp.]|nr:SDR family NAD(P)-dependent oxidoreductase [Armatimonadota bacterium]